MSFEAGRRIAAEKNRLVAKALGMEEGPRIGPHKPRHILIKPPAGMGAVVYGIARRIAVERQKKQFRPIGGDGKA